VVLSQGSLLFYALIFLRVTGFTFTMPIWGTHLSFTPIKILFAVVLTSIIAPVVNSISLSEIEKMSDGTLWVISIMQVFVGIVFGFVSRMVFFSLSITGEWIGIASGATSSQIFNPAQGGMSNIFDHFYMTLASLLFLTLGAHHVLITYFVDSFRVFDPSAMNLAQLNIQFIMSQFVQALIYGIKLALPVTLAILIANIIMGVLARVVPQMNVFATSLQINFMLTIIVMIISLPLLGDELEKIFSISLSQFKNFIEVL